MSEKNEAEYQNNDFTDYFMLFYNSGRPKEFIIAFNKLVEDAKDAIDVFPELFELDNILTKEADEIEYEDINFYDALNEKYIEKPISFKAIVRGEGAKPYVYPIKVKLTCDNAKGEACKICGLFMTNGNLTLDLTSINPLELIDCNNAAKLKIIKSRVGIRQCGRFKVDLLEQKYMQEIFLSPMAEDLGQNIDTERKEQRFIIRHAFSKGANIIPNKAYKFFAVPVPHPKNQSLIYYVKKAEEEESSLENFKLANQDIKDLKVFQPKNDDYDSIQEKLNHIYKDLSENISPIIVHRDDIMLSCDLAFHSVLHFYLGESFEKGWVETLLVGDTSVGKTKVAVKLSNHYKLGVVQGAENSTIAGLIGGMTKFESLNIMTWGLLPMNDSRLVILDEMSGIDKNVFSELTRIRSEGIAERTIVGGSSSTSAKVRLIWISNPRKRAMRLYDNSCDMIKELVGNPEDISRFDFILTASDDEVTSEQINRRHTINRKNKMKHVYTSELCNKLVMWAWSRKAKNVIFDKGVEDAILFYAIQMSKKYTSNFPLVLGSTIRLKLARLSIALAIRLFSIDERDSENVIVKENHVAYVSEFLERIYDKPSFGYGEHSEYIKKGEAKTENSKAEMIKEMDYYCGGNTKSFIVNMLTNPRITAIEVRDFAGCNRDNGDGFRTKLVSKGFLIKKAGFYIKSTYYRNILKSELKRIEKDETKKKNS